MEHKVDELLVFRISEKFDEGLRRKFFAHFVRGEAVLGEAIVKPVHNCTIASVNVRTR